MKAETETSWDQALLASKETRAVNERIMIHQGRSGVWFMISMISVILSGAFHAPAKASSAWETWLINWHSNLLLYFAGAALILCLLDGGRATFLHYRVKKSFQGR